MEVEEHSEIHVRPQQPQDSSRHKEPQFEVGERSPSRVRFNSKVHVSPTPPSSDASSSAFRSFASVRRGSRQIDGTHDDEIERGRTRSRAFTKEIEQYAWVEGAKRLSKALSESPSREELVQSSRQAQ